MRKLISILFLFVFMLGCSTVPVITQKKHNDEMAKLAAELGMLSLQKDKLVKERNLRSEKTGAQFEEMIRHANSLQKRINEQKKENSNLKRLTAKLNKELADEIKSGKIKIKMLKDRVILSVSNKILFDTNQIELKEESLKALDAVILALSRCTFKGISIEGNTDNVPVKQFNKRWKDNWELSAQRALVVVRYLLENSSLNPQKVTAVGRGKYNPVDTNETTIGKFNNRRVDIIITPTVE